MKHLLLPLLALCLGDATADTLRVAVAANFAAAAAAIADAFASDSGHRVQLSPGSTGKHYAQIRHGAPFAVFLAADVERPARLEAEGLTVPGTRFTYAVGRLALWSPQPGLVDDAGKVLGGGDFHHLAMANPRLAPYGRAARQVLERLQLWQPLQDRLVMGENIGQTFRFVGSGGAELGLVALSQLQGPQPAGGSRWLPPAQWYDPIEQQVVLLDDSPAARAFVDFLRSERALAIIRAYGYHAAADAPGTGDAAVRR